MVWNLWILLWQCTSIFATFAIFVFSKLARCLALFRCFRILSHWFANHVLQVLQLLVSQGFANTSFAVLHLLCKVSQSFANICFAKFRKYKFHKVLQIDFSFRKDSKVLQGYHRNRLFADGVDSCSSETGWVNLRTLWQCRKSESVINVTGHLPVPVSFVYRLAGAGWIKCCKDTYIRAVAFYKLTRDQSW